MLRLACVVGGRWCLDRETSWSEPVPEAVQGRAGGHVLPIVVALARRIIVETRWSLLLCASWSQAGPATHGQTHNQRKRRVGWSLRADLEWMVAALGAWTSAPEC